LHFPTGEKKNEEKSEEKKVKTKKARPALTGKGICCSHPLSIECYTVGHEGWATMQCTTEFPSAGFAAQTKEERRTKGSDEKVAVGNELLGNAFFRERCPPKLQRGRRAAKLARMNLRSIAQRSSFALVSFWPCDRVAGSETSVSGHATELQAS